MDYATVRPSPKRRQSLLTRSPPGTPYLSPFTSGFDVDDDDLVADIPMRPSSRLEFLGQRGVDEHGMKEDQ